MNDNQPKDEDFRLLDFDGLPIEEKNNNQNEVIVQKINGQSIQLQQVTSIDELTPEMQNTVKKLFKTVSKEDLKKFTNALEEKKDVMFDKNNKSAFGKLSEEEQNVFKNKMSEWDVPQELSQLNASVILSWANNTIKENK